MAKALGQDDATAPAQNTHLLAPHIKGEVGLLFSPQKPEDIIAYLSTFHPLDYVRAGGRATRDFTLPAGMLFSRGGEIPENEDVPLAHSQEPTLRKLNVPTRLVKGKVVLENEHVVCRDGEQLTSGQTMLLKMFGVAMAELNIMVKAYWAAASGEVTVLQAEQGRDMEVDEADDE